MDGTQNPNEEISEEHICDKCDQVFKTETQLGYHKDDRHMDVIIILTLPPTLQIPVLPKNPILSSLIVNSVRRNTETELNYLNTKMSTSQICQRKYHRITNTQIKRLIIHQKPGKELDQGLNVPYVGTLGIPRAK